MKRLNSRNIIKFIQIYESANKFYIIQEKADESLYDILCKFGKFDEKQAI